MTLVDGETLADRIDASDISVPADSTVIRCFNFAHASVRGLRVTSITFGLHQMSRMGFRPGQCGNVACTKRCRSHRPELI
jgi:hypothetical protein